MIMGVDVELQKAGVEAAKVNKKDYKVPKYVEENPCYKESQLSLKCLDENGYDREKCSLYFQNYRNCHDFWTQVKRDRQGKGVKPILPVPEDREAIKQEYFKKGKG